MARGVQGQIKRKLSSQQGLSILIALAFVLICTVIAAIVISSASVNAERIKNYRAEQQSYLAKVSALNLAQDIIVGDNEDEADGIHIKKTTSGSKTTYAPQGTVDDLEIVNWMCKRLNKESSTAKLVLTVDASSLNTRSAAQVQPVQLELSFDGTSVRARAYDSLDGNVDSTGAVSNISRTFSVKEESGVMSWYMSGATS